MTERQKLKIKELEEEIKLIKYRNLDVKKRDNYKCRLCGEVEGLQIHHITPREFGGNNESYNLMLVCLSCHLFLHCNPKMVIKSKQGISSIIKIGLTKRKQEGKPLGRLKGSLDKKPRNKLGYLKENRLPPNISKISSLNKLS